jgi:TonB family protein
MKSLAVFLLTTSLVTVTTSTFAQTTDSQTTTVNSPVPLIVGVIQREDQAAIEDASITVFDAVTAKGFRTKSTAGKFALNQVPDGDYMLKVEKTGYAPLFGALQVRQGNPQQLRCILIEDPKGLGIAKAGGPLDASDASLPSPDPSPKPKKLQKAKIVYQPRPVYPDSARSERIQGRVSMDVVIRKDGTVDNLVVKSAPSNDLAWAALTAARQWRYKPVLADGQAVEADTTIDVNFQLTLKP